MGDSVAKKVKMYLLGPCELFIDGTRILPKDWKSKKALTLLKYLVTYRGRMIRREVLLELLWPEDQPEKATRNLYTAIHTIRRMLEPELRAYQDSTYIRYSNGMYFFNVDDSCWIDVIEFERLYRKGLELEHEDPYETLGKFRQAFSMYRGEYLTEESYADWAVPSREFLREMFISTGLRIARILAWDKTQLAESITVGRRILAEDPYREEIHQMIISYLIEAGRFAEAAVQYRQLEKLLAEEFDLPPSPESQELYEKMQQLANDKTPQLVEELSGTTPSDLMDPLDSSGPLVCDRKTFDSIHALALRGQSRHGEPHTLIRVSIAGPTHSNKYLGLVFDRLRTMLRRGDALCFDHDCVLIHLPQTDEDGSTSVKQRIESMLTQHQIPEASIDVQLFEP